MQVNSNLKRDSLSLENLKNKKEIIEFKEIFDAHLKREKLEENIQSSIENFKKELTGLGANGFISNTKTRLLQEKSANLDKFLEGSKNETEKFNLKNTLNKILKEYEKTIKNQTNNVLSQKQQSLSATSNGFFDASKIIKKV